MWSNPNDILFYDKKKLFYVSVLFNTCYRCSSNSLNDKTWKQSSSGTTFHHIRKSVTQKLHLVSASFNFYNIFWLNWLRNFACVRSIALNRIFYFSPVNTYMVSWSSEFVTSLFCVSSGSNIRALRKHKAANSYVDAGIAGVPGLK